MATLTTAAGTNQLVTQAQQQGQAQQAQDNAAASNAQNTYNSANSQANSAYNNLQNYTSNMVNPQSYYTQELGTLEQQNGYNPAQMAAANQSLFQLNGALNGANQQFATPGGVETAGMSPTQLASYESNAINPLQTGLANQQNVVNTLNSQLQNYMTGANQFAQLGTSYEQQQSQNYQALYQQSVAQMNAAGQTMASLEQTAAQQGMWTADAASQYQTAYNGYITAQATAEQAQAAMLMAVPTAAGQTISNQGAINQFPGGTTIDGYTSTNKSTNSSSGNSGGLAVGTANPQQTLSVGTAQPSGGNLQ